MCGAVGRQDPLALRRLVSGNAAAGAPTAAPTAAAPALPLALASHSGPVNFCAQSSFCSGDLSAMLAAPRTPAAGGVDATAGARPARTGGVRADGASDEGRAWMTRDAGARVRGRAGGRRGQVVCSIGGVRGRHMRTSRAARPLALAGERGFCGSGR